MEYSSTPQFIPALLNALSAAPFVTVTGVKRDTLRNRLIRAGLDMRVATDYQRGAVIVAPRKDKRNGR
jgi:hypothetical protein